jgi:Uma2 family endonuclease
MVVKHRFTAAEYHRMGEAGVFGEDDRVELIEGEVVQMAPIGPDRAECVDSLVELFVHTFGREARVRAGNPVLLDPHSEPEPDVALVRRRAGGYGTRHPSPEDVLLLVEVADTSVLYDRRQKVPLYARAGIAEVWLVSLPDQTLTVYRDPARADYQSVLELRRGERVAPLAFPDRELAVDQILG